MERTAAQIALREKYLTAFVQTAVELQKQTDDREVTLELMIEAAAQLHEQLESELEEIRSEND